MAADNMGGKVQPCGKEVLFDCIKKCADARAEGSSMGSHCTRSLCVSAGTRVLAYGCGEWRGRLQSLLGRQGL